MQSSQGLSTETFDLPELKPKYDLFMAGLGEALPAKFDEGICNGYAIMAMRAQALGQEDKYIERLKFLHQANAELITRMTKLLLEYQYKFQKAQAKKEYSTDEIQEKILNSFTTDEKDLIKKAQDLYYFLSSLTAAFGLDHYLDLMSDKFEYQQSNHVALMNLVTRDEKDSPRPKIEPVLRVDFNFTEEELLEFIKDKNHIHEKDFVVLHTVMHAMYMTKINGEFILWNNESRFHLPNEQEVVKFLKQKYPSGTLPYTFNIYRSDKLMDVQPRPKAEAVVNAILNKRGDKISIDIEAQDKITSLAIAVLNNNKAVVNVLLERKASLDYIDQFGDSLLIMALGRGNTEIAKILIQHKADVNFIGEDRYTALCYAVSFNHLEIVKILLAKDRVTNRLYVLQLALEKKHNDVAAELLAAGITVPPQNAYQFATLAAEAGNETVMNKLITECKLDLASPAASGILNAAAIDGHDAIVKSLLEKGVKPPVGDALEEVLITALKNKHPSVIELLIDPKEFSSFRDSKGNSLLMYAIQTDNEWFAKQLIDKYKIDVKEDKNLFVAAAINGNARILDLLISAGAPLVSETPILMLTNDRLCMKKLIEDCKFDVNQQDPKEGTALHKAIIENRWFKVFDLIEYKADPNMKQPGSEKSPLLLALEGGYFNMAELLLKNGATADLAMLQSFIKIDSAPHVKFLLDHGLNIEALDRQAVCDMHCDHAAAVIRFDHTKIDSEKLIWLNSQIMAMLDSMEAGSSAQSIESLRQKIKEIFEFDDYPAESKFYKMIRCLESCINVTSEAKASQSSSGLFSSPYPPGFIMSAIALMKEVDEKFSRTQAQLKLPTQST
ncbi:MAG: ankyrin repeat domain-containing protein [Gammaproteobacteria bacterium]